MKRKLKFLLICFMCICSMFCFTACNDNAKYWKQKVASFQAENNTDSFKKDQIIFIGDSITDGYDLDKFYSLHSFPLEIYNRGINGDTTSGLLKRLDVSLFDLEPSKIVILIGINDLNGGKSSAYVINNYGKILTQIKTRLPQCKVYIQSIYPVNGDGIYKITKSTNKIIEVNTELITLANEFGYTYIDVFSLLATNGNLLNSEYANDGLHPNNKGYEIVTACIVNYLQD